MSILHTSSFIPYTTPMNRTAVEQIKERLPVEEVIGQYVKLEKAGKSLKARCPFHNEKSPSFFVSPERGGYYCFGCGAKGDIFSFVEQFEGLDFRGALKILAERAGVKLVYDQKADGEREKLFDIMEKATEYFETQLAKSVTAKEYVKNRGISDKTREEFRIGFAPEGWNNLHNYLKGKGYNDLILEKAGLIKKKDIESSGASTLSYYDRFRGRVMFPISDSSGRVVAFSGRILKDDGKSAKYLNSPDTPLYDKSLILYGLDKAKSEIRRLNYTIMVEGQMDLVMSHQSGVKNTVAASGTALTDETVGENGVISNLGLVRRLSPNVIIAFDSDTAGRKAAMRASGIALSMGMDVKIADIVGGKDPADLVREDVEKWKTALRQAKPIIEFELDNVLRENTDPRKVPRVLRERVFPFLARIESNMDKDHFVKMIADRSKISADAVWQDLKNVEKALKEKTATSVTSGSTTSTSTSGGNQTYAMANQSNQNHFDLIERRLFGLLTLMEKENISGVSEYREQVKKILGNSYGDFMTRIQPMMSDITFEAEAIFGADRERLAVHAKELILNFEEDILNKDLIISMQELKQAEKDSNHSRVAELAQKCQALSIRKGELAKRRKG